MLSMNQTGINNSNHQIFFQRSSFLTQGTSLLHALRNVLIKKYKANPSIENTVTNIRITSRSEGSSPSSSSSSIASILGFQNDIVYIKETVIREKRISDDKYKKYKIKEVIDFKEYKLAECIDNDCSSQFDNIDLSDIKYNKFELSHFSPVDNQNKVTIEPKQLLRIYNKFVTFFSNHTIFFTL